MDRAQHERGHTYQGKARKRDGEHEAGARTDGDTNHGEGHRPHHAPRLDGEEVGTQYPAREAQHLAPRVQRSDGDVGDSQAEQRRNQEPKARAAVG